MSVTFVYYECKYTNRTDVPLFYSRGRSAALLFAIQLPRRAAARPTPAMTINPPAVRKTD